MTDTPTPPAADPPQKADLQQADPAQADPAQADPAQADHAQAEPGPTLAPIQPGQPLWIFGYGSLLWNPEFPVAERVPALLTGYHRAFCMRSIHHRGTEDAPGLVLALDAQPGASCEGLALRAAPGHEAATLAGLRARELISSAYVEHLVPLSLTDGRAVTALAYVIEPGHVQYCGGLALEEQAEIIAHAIGGRGPNTDYLFNTVAHLAEIGVQDGELDWLADRVRHLTGARPTSDRL